MRRGTWGQGPLAAGAAPSASDDGDVPGVAARSAERSATPVGGWCGRGGTETTGGEELADGADRPPPIGATVREEAPGNARTGGGAVDDVVDVATTDGGAADGDATAGGGVVTGGETDSGAPAAGATVGGRGGGGETTGNAMIGGGVVGADGAVAETDGAPEGPPGLVAGPAADVCLTGGAAETGAGAGARATGGGADTRAAGGRAASARAAASSRASFGSSKSSSAEAGPGAAWVVCGAIVAPPHEAMIAMIRWRAAQARRCDSIGTIEASADVETD